MLRFPVAVMAVMAVTSIFDLLDMPTAKNKHPTKIVKP
jgi:hypothetical protein